MYKALKGYLRSFNQNGFTRSATRWMCAATLALILPLVACAYTVVLRSGRRIEIPAKFTVTTATLTYESAPGLNVTLLLATIDIRATERANDEPEGSFLRRVQLQEGSTAATRARQPRRELTEQDIEAGRLARRKSEQEYEQRRIELGLPSLEDVRRRDEEETKRLTELALQSQAEENQEEAYWRSRSTQLRNEIATLNSEISYIRARLTEMPEYSVAGTYGFVTGVTPSFQTGFRPGLHGQRGPATVFPTVTGHPGFMRGNRSGAQQTGFLAFGGLGQGHFPINAGRAFGGFRRRGNISSGIIAPGLPAFGLPYANYDYAGERANLIYRLHELEQAQVGFLARWRILEDEARRAGAQPGWLRR